MGGGGLFILGCGGGSGSGFSLIFFVFVLQFCVLS